MPAAPRFAAAALDLLACPHCGGALDPVGASATVGCYAGHRFDVNRGGYLTLLGGRSRTDTADAADMVAARAAFLTAGHYTPIRQAVIDAVTGDGPVLDVGAGPGWYLSGVVDAADDRIGVALDSAKPAARLAARSHPRVAAVVADAWSTLPVRTAAVGTVLSVFAPRDLAEIARVLEPGGRLVTVTPEPDHLAELRDRFGLLSVDEGKVDALTEPADRVGLAAVSRQLVRYPVELSGEQIADLVRMGPTARHRGATEITALAHGLGSARVTVAVAVASWLRR